MKKAAVTFLLLWCHSAGAGAESISLELHPARSLPGLPPAVRLIVNRPMDSVGSSPRFATLVFIGPDGSEHIPRCSDELRFCQVPIPDGVGPVAVNLAPPSNLDGPGWFREGRFVTPARYEVQAILFDGRDPLGVNAVRGERVEWTIETPTGDDALAWKLMDGKASWTSKSWQLTAADEARTITDEFPNSRYAIYVAGFARAKDAADRARLLGSALRKDPNGPMATEFNYRLGKLYDELCIQSYVRKEGIEKVLEYRRLAAAHLQRAIHLNGSDRAVYDAKKQLATQRPTEEVRKLYEEHLRY